MDVKDREYGEIFEDNENARSDEAQLEMVKGLLKDFDVNFDEEDVHEFPDEISDDVIQEDRRRTRILSPLLDNFFDGFNDFSGLYRMRPWLRKLYPRDAEAALLNQR